jgi:CDP-glucose 4,6-dehydratase
MHGYAKGIHAVQPTLAGRQSSVEGLGIMFNGQFWSGKKVFITGHEGFLGSWLTKTLLSLGADIIGLDKVIDRPISVLDGAREKILAVRGDVADLNLVMGLVGQHKPQIVFHLAAEAIVGEALKDPVNTFKTNIEGTWNVLESVRQNGQADAVIVASSDKAYGSHKVLPYKEDIALKGDHPYDVSKSCTDLLCQTYYTTYHVPVCVTRCGNIYGPGDYHFSRIVPDAVCCALQKKQFVIRSDGQYTRDYIYIEDIINAYIVLAEKVRVLNLEGEAFNFSNEDPISVLKLHEKIQKICGNCAIEPKIMNQAQHEITHQYLSSKKARDMLHWQARYSLEEGLKKTLDWYGQYVLTGAEHKG